MFLLGLLSFFFAHDYVLSFRISLCSPIRYWFPLLMLQCVCLFLSIYLFIFVLFFLFFYCSSVFSPHLLALGLGDCLYFSCAGFCLFPTHGSLSLSHISFFNTPVLGLIVKYQHNLQIKQVFMIFTSLSLSSVCINIS